MALYDISLLYIEDDTETVLAMKVVLEEYFQHIYIANDAAQAMELFQNNRIDLVLSDIELPDGSGLELVEKLKRLDDSLVVILFSAYDNREYLLKAIELSVCDYLIKPFHLEEFDRVVTKCVKKLQKEQIRHFAYKDQLTGVFNRHKMIEVFESLRSEGVQFGCIMIDIDDFKQINDTYGHVKGDLVLQKLSTCIKRRIRQGDFFGRWGGEEFVLFIPDIDKLRLFDKAEALRRELQQCDYGMEKEVTVSMGVGIYDGEETLDMLIEKVDKALYKSKRSGKNKVEIA